MADRRGVGGWLDGPRADGEPAGAPQEPPALPGVRLGLPAEGHGSVAGFGRRVAGLAVDWALALLIAGGLLRGLGLGSFAPLLVLLVEHTLLVGTAGGAVGHRVAGLRVVRLGPGPVGIPRALLRSTLLALAVPPLIWDADQRGLHDRVAGTVVVRA